MSDQIDWSLLEHVREKFRHGMSMTEQELCFLEQHTGNNNPWQRDIQQERDHLSDLHSFYLTLES